MRNFKHVSDIQHETHYNDNGKPSSHFYNVRDFLHEGEYSLKDSSTLFRDQIFLFLPQSFRFGSFFAGPPCMQTSNIRIEFASNFTILIPREWLENLISRFNSPHDWTICQQQHIHLKTRGNMKNTLLIIHTRNSPPFLSANKFSL